MNEVREAAERLLATLPVQVGYYRADIETVARAVLADAGRAGDAERDLREALSDLLRWSLSDQETRLFVVVTGGSRAVDGSEPGASLHDRCDRIAQARERARAALAAAPPSAAEPDDPPEFDEPLGRAMSHAELAESYRRRVAPDPRDAELAALRKALELILDGADHAEDCESWEFETEAPDAPERLAACDCPYGVGHAALTTPPVPEPRDAEVTALVCGLCEHPADDHNETFGCMYTECHCGRRRAAIKRSARAALSQAPERGAAGGEVSVDIGRWQSTHGLTTSEIREIDAIVDEANGACTDEPR